MSPRGHHKYISTIPGHLFSLELPLRRCHFAVQAHLVQDSGHGAPDVQLLLRLLLRHLGVLPESGREREETEKQKSTDTMVGGSVHIEYLRTNARYILFYTIHTVTF